MKKYKVHREMNGRRNNDNDNDLYMLKKVLRKGSTLN